VEPHARTEQLGLVTDLYEFTMAASYRSLGMHERATFSLFVRTLPAKRSFLVAAGIEEAIRRITSLGFEKEGIEYLVSTGQLSHEEAAALARTRFTGDVHAVREGRVVFAGEPILEVDAPIIEAQLAETLVINAVHYSTAVATKAARCVAAARGKPVVDFGLRRAPGIDGGMELARASWLVGFAGTSNVEAGRLLGIPTSGTVAHAFIEAMPSERAAFEAWARVRSDPVTLLVDTYDTPRGVRVAAEVARELRARGRRVTALRIDSGDLAELTRDARRVLDDAGLQDIQLVVSGGLDEYEIDALERSGAPIDGYAVGTSVAMSTDAPSLDMAYKIVEYAGRPCLKLSGKKATLASPKQVWRRRDAAGRWLEDVVTLREEPAPGPDWEPLLEPVVRNGEVTARPSLADLRSRHAEELERFPGELRAIDAKHTWPVSLSPALESRHRAAVEETKRREGL